MKENTSGVAVSVVTMSIIKSTLLCHVSVVRRKSQRMKSGKRPETRENNDRIISPDKEEAGSRRGWKLR